MTTRPPAPRWTGPGARSCRAWRSVVLAAAVLALAGAAPGRDAVAASGAPAGDGGALDAAAMGLALDEWVSLATDRILTRRIADEDSRRQALESMAGTIGLTADLLLGTLDENLAARQEELEQTVLAGLAEELGRGERVLGDMLIGRLDGIHPRFRAHWARRVVQLRHRLRSEGSAGEGSWMAEVTAPGRAEERSLGEPEAALPDPGGITTWVSERLLVGPRDDRSRRLAGARVDVNRADRKQLATIPGIGRIKAARIVEVLRERGFVESLDELDDLPGFGDGTLENLWTWARAGDVVHPPKAWTVLYYLNGDDPRIELFAWLLLQDLERVGSSETVNIVVQLDRMDRRRALMNGAAGVDFFGGQNFSGARRFYVRRDDDPGLDEIRSIPRDQRHALSVRLSSALKDPVGEVESDRWENLRDFVRWGTTHYPAERTALVFVGHGGSLALSPDASSVPFGQASLGMGIDELGRALREGAPGGTLDMVFLHACSMGGIELAWELTGVAGHLVASEDLAFLVPFHHRWLGRLGEPGITTADVAREIVSTYGAHVRDHHRETADYYGVTMAAVDLAVLENHKATVAALVERLADPGHGDLVRSAPWIDSESNVRLPAVDLIHLAQELAGGGDPAAAAVVEGFGPALPAGHIPDDLVLTDAFPAGSPLIAEVHNAVDPTARGLSILLPSSDRPAPGLAAALGPDWLPKRLAPTRFARETAILGVLDALAR